MILEVFTLRSLLPPTERLGEIGLRLAITAIVAFAIVRLAFLIVSRVESFIGRAGGGSVHALQRARTFGSIIRKLSVTTVIAGALIHGLEIMGWNVAPLLAGAGLLGVAISFGAQTLVRDVIAGLVILAEDQFAVGDVIEVNGVAATVEDMAVRSTTLRDGDGFVRHVPNGEMRIVTNRSRGWNRATADGTVAPGADAERALELCRKVVSEFNADKLWRDRLLDPAELWGIESLTERGILIRVSARTRPGSDSATVARELRRRLLHGLVEAGIALARAWPVPAEQGK